MTSAHGSMIGLEKPPRTRSPSPNSGNTPSITGGELETLETESESHPTRKASRAPRWESLAWHGRFFAGVVALLQIYMFVVMALVVVVFTIGFGWTSVVVTSGSMSPLISAGDIVLASPHSGDALSPGTVVVFDPARSGLMTHRIVSVNPDGTYVTKGDTNASADSTPVENDDIVGIGRFLVPRIGHPLAAFWAGELGLAAIWVVGALLMIWLARFALLDRYHPGLLRRDPSYLDFHGVRGVGGSVLRLRERIRQERGITHRRAVAIIGAGNLGQALANDGGLAKRGFDVVAVYDKDARKVGTKVGEVAVQSLGDLASDCVGGCFEMAILAVPATGAQSVTDQLVRGGVESILNLAPVRVEVPESVSVRQVDEVDRYGDD